MIATKQTITRMRQEAEVLRRNLCPREAELLELWAAEFAARVEQDENECSRVLRLAVSRF